MDLLTTRKEIANFLGVSEKTVSRLLEKNEMPEPLYSSGGKKKDSENEKSRESFKRYVFSSEQLTKTENIPADQEKIL